MYRCCPAQPAMCRFLSRRSGWRRTLLGDCCDANFTVGCDDAVCCGLVCEIDPVCCSSAWDFVCANEAQALCSCP